MDEFPALHRFNRSEAPTSVALAMLLAEPALGRRLLSRLAASLGWTMAARFRNGAGQPFDLGGGGLEATALFHPYRDLRRRLNLKGKQSAAGTSEGAAPWRGEIDVVAVVPRHIAVGIEIKVLSTTAKLADQVHGQAAGLKLLSEVYDCRFQAQIALAPAFPGGFPDDINRLLFADLLKELQALREERAPMSDLIASVQKQLELVLRLTKPPQLKWNLVTLSELCAMAADPMHASMFVGVLEGLEALQTKRLRWKVASSHLGENWYPLPEVVARIKEVQQPP